jgi:hypothetical protein
MPDQSPNFDLIPYHRNIPSLQLLDDLARVARLLSAPTLTQAAYRNHSQFNPLTLTTRFGNWNRALTQAGLRPSRHFRVRAKTVLADVRRVAKKLNTNHLTLTQYTAHGQYSITLIYRHFNNWSTLVLAAGLKPSTYHPKTTDIELFNNLEHLWRHLNHQPKCTDLIPPHSRFGLTPYQRRFGGFRNALIAFTQWKQTNQMPKPRQKLRKTTRSINWRLRYLILKRDNFKCQASSTKEFGIMLPEKTSRPHWRMRSENTFLACMSRNLSADETQPGGRTETQLPGCTL